MKPTQNAPESWKPVLGYEGIYEVFDQGRVKSLARLDTIGRSMPTKILNPYTRKDGYKVVCLTKDGGLSWKRVNRLVLEAFVGPCPEGMESCHNSPNPGDNRLINLRWDTSRENKIDQVRMGTNKKSQRTHCPHGHELNAPNLVRYDAKHGRRNCISCARTRAHIQRNPHLKPHFQEVSDSYYAEIMKKSA